MKALGLEFAPFNIPLKRRLQTLAVLYWTTSFLFFGFGFLIIGLIIILFTDYYYLPLLYGIWYFIDRKKPTRGGRRFAWVRHWPIWWWMRDYFPVRLIKTAELDPNKNYVSGYHPHGIFCVGAWCSFCTEALDFAELYPNITPYLLTLEGQFMFPIHRELLLASGLCSVHKDSIDWIMTNEGKGNLTVIVLGGAMEALDAHSGLAKLTLSKRRGFARLALRHGASLVPVFSFGENELFTQVSNPEGSFLRRLQNRLVRCVGFSTPLIQGRGVFQYNYGYLPHRKPLDIIMGKPIDVDQNENPTEEEVTVLHKKYIDGLNELFETHKGNYENYKNTTLEIV